MRILLFCPLWLVIGCSSHRDDDRPDPRRAAAIHAAYDYVLPRAPWLIAGGGSTSGAEEFADHWLVDLPTRSPYGALRVEVPKAADRPPRAYFEVSFEVSLDSPEELDVLRRTIQTWTDTIQTTPVPAQ